MLRMEDLAHQVTRESFYSGHNGTTKAELNSMLVISPSSFLLFSLLQYYWIASFPNKIWLHFAVEFVVIILPGVLSVTVLCDHILLLLAAQLTASLLLFLTTNQRRHFKNNSRWQDILMPSSRQFLTNFRVIVNAATVVSILAVDFQVFSRRFAKTETYGTGLMDAGVGLFMIGNALISPEARGKTLFQQRSISSGLRNILRAVVSCSPLLVLGFLRLLSVKTIDYHEHVSEYGVHWNFFFTLAAVIILVTAVFTLVPIALSGVMAAILAFTYQYLLNMHGLEDYILHGSDGQGSRNGIMEANREGIYSCIGYSTIYLAGISLGRFLFQQRSSVGDWARCLFQLLLFNSIFLLLTTVVPQMAEPVSRRLANLPYVVWIVTLCINMLLVCLTLDLFLAVVISERGASPQAHQVHDLLIPYGPSRRRLNGPSAVQKPKPARDQSTNLTSEPRSLIIDAINKNQLFNFLLANLITGAINLSMDTISASSVVGFVTVVAYTFVLCLVEVVLYTWNIKTKFW